MKKETKVVCPVCGAEFAIGEHEHQVKNATVIGKDSGLGTIEMPLANKKSKAKIRIEQLKARGIDTSKMYAMTGTDGSEKIGVVIKGELQIVDTDDNIERIMRGGTINTAHIFKQHVLAKMLKMLTEVEHINKRGARLLKQDYDRGYYDLDGLNDYIKYFGYDYSWNVLNEELMRQSAMHRHGDEEMLEQDNVWYNRVLAIKMADDFYNQLLNLIFSAKRHKCKGKSYIRYDGADKVLKGIKKSKHGYMFISEIPDFKKAVLRYISAIGRASNPVELHHAVENFCKIRPSLYIRNSELRSEFKPVIFEDWINAYKGYGAYFSMQNLILFHDCKIHLGDGTVLGKDKSMSLLREWALTHHKEGYWLIGALKQLLRDNNFDIEAKQAEWAARYSK